MNIFNHKQIKTLVITTVVLMSTLPAAKQASAEGRQVPDNLIKVEQDRFVDIGAAKLITVEPHLAADPRDPKHLVAAVTLIEKYGDPRHPVEGDSEFFCSALTSFDAGRTWTRHDFPGDRCIDPWVAILPNGKAIFAGLAYGDRGFGLVCFRSADGGRTWSDKPVSLGLGHDHGTLAVDATGGAFDGSVYVAAYQGQSARGKPTRHVSFIARSTDGGASFQNPARVITSNLATWTMNPVILSDGLLVVPLINIARIQPGGRFGKLERWPSWVITSTDGGKTFSPPLFMTDVCTTGRGFPELAVDASTGPYQDRLYFVCNDQAYERVYVVTSADRGETWSEPLVVNRGSGNISFVQNSVIAVNRNGVVGVAWYDARNDRRQYRGTSRCQEIFFTASLDGGQTFLPEVKVSSAENCSDTPANGEAGRRYSAGGDYFGLAAAADGRFHVLWADSRTGIYQLRTTALSLDSKTAQE